MRISLVAALNRRHAIGLDNQLLWHLPRDLRHFKEVTLGKPVVMGRSTFESIGRPLPGRTNIVLSRRLDWRAPGCLVVPDLASALVAAGEAPEVMIIGGAQVYAQTLPRAHRLYLTHVDNDLEGDAWFPRFDEDGWRTVEVVEHPADERNPWACRFAVYERPEGPSRARCEETGPNGKETL